MKKLFHFASLLILVSLAASAAPEKSKLRKTALKAPDEYIVIFKDRSPASKRQFQDKADRLARQFGGKIKLQFNRTLSGFSIRLPASAAALLSEHPDIDFVEENGVVVPALAQMGAPWGLDRLDQRDRPLDSCYENRGVTGAGVTVFVLDTGVRISHREFEGRASTGPDFVDDGYNGADHSGHGTHVAAIVAGRTYGVAKQARICSVRVLGPGVNTWDQVIAGVEWVTANRVGPSVVNMSLAGGGSESVDRAIRASIASGVAYVVAAGNNNMDATAWSPARVEEVVTVAASDMNDARAYFSNYGRAVDLFAPGINVLSASFNNDDAAAYGNGTSAAAPHVAGLAALHLERFPNSAPWEVSAALVRFSTCGTILDAGTDSTNRIAFTRDYGTPGQIFYRIVSVNSGKVLDVAGASTAPGTQIVQYSYWGGANQLWTVEPRENGSVSIMSAYSGLVLEVDRSSTENGAPVVQRSYAGGAHQRWVLEAVGEGAVAIRNANSGKLVNVPYASTNDGMSMVQYDSFGGANEHWLLLPATD